METLITIVHVFVSIFLVLSILLQSGKGGGMGAALGGGGGGAQQVFGGRGAGNFLTKMTTACAIVFMLTSLGLSYMSSKHVSVVKESKQATGLEAAPAAEAEADAEEQAEAAPAEEPATDTEAPAVADEQPAEDDSAEPTKPQETK